MTWIAWLYPAPHIPTNPYATLSISLQGLDSLYPSSSFKLNWQLGERFLKLPFHHQPYVFIFEYLCRRRFAVVKLLFFLNFIGPLHAISVPLGVNFPHTRAIYYVSDKTASAIIQILIFIITFIQIFSFKCLSDEIFNISLF